MATSTLIQFLGPGEGQNTSNRAQVETFLAGGTIAAGDAVAFDLSKTGADKVLYVVEATGGAKALIVGVALTPAAANEKVDVCIGGYVAEADVATGVTAGAQLCGSATAGRLGLASGGSVFLSALQTGTGSAQNIAHGLGVVPDLVFVITEDVSPATTGAVTVVYGTHTSTNAIITVNSNKTYRVVALTFAGTPVATALTAESGNKAAILFHKKF
ncbi:hypothetical protein K0U83_24000 [bacterium]|nr:hypothetical protein [bacterium]